MTVDARIKAALDVFKDPVENAVYQGKAERYYTFNYATLGTDHADDAPQHERYLVQVHFFAPLNFNHTKRVRDTKRALFDAGFTFPDTTSASDEDGRHIVFECEIAEGVDMDGKV